MNGTVSEKFSADTPRVIQDGNPGSPVNEMNYPRSRRRSAVRLFPRKPGVDRADGVAVSPAQVLGIGGVGGIERPANLQTDSDAAVVTESHECRAILDGRLGRYRPHPGMAPPRPGCRSDGAGGSADPGRLDREPAREPNDLRSDLGNTAPIGHDTMDARSTPDIQSVSHDRAAFEMRVQNRTYLPLGKSLASSLICAGQQNTDRQ